ncbi:VOC family protein [Azospirillum sp. TSO22-1]|uniref:VOC family protein n=1 Tax=Azospirillum sp. TSO22-1 TaxID=716789 RepID=UPI000D608C25|nr:VOC family protein [Azospirillum sp. TSO22-1]PWC53085.1 drug:proton antiporter [Azospirillum sp. TSO22-1]
MHDPNFVILYVADAPASAAFYAELLGIQPVESSPGFAMFALPSGFKLGLWARHTVQPAAASAAGSGELVFTVADADAVGATHADWSRRGLRIAQEPTAMEFGHTFTALDPDGHRLRVYAPGEP